MKKIIMAVSIVSCIGLNDGALAGGGGGNADCTGSGFCGVLFCTPRNCAAARCEGYLCKDFRISDSRCKSVSYSSTCYNSNGADCLIFWQYWVEDDDCSHALYGPYWDCWEDDAFCGGGGA